MCLSIFSCPFCQRFADTWEELAEHYVGNEGVKIADMNCEEYRKICKRFRVKEYPFILLLKNGEVFQRFGNDRKRTKDNLITFVEYHLTSTVRDET